MSIHLVLLALLTLACKCQAISRQQTFVTNSNFENPDRWLEAEHDFPCAGDKIVFDIDATVSMFVQTNFTVTEIILPLNGEIIFGDGVSWGTDNDLSSCHDDQNHDHVFHYNPQVDDWFDTSNWQASSSGKTLGPKDSLDIEKVPCEYDDAVFPEQNSWTTNLLYSTRVESLSVWQKYYTTSQFADYRSSGSGKYQFQGEPGVDVTIPSNNLCSDPTGCACRSSSITANIHGHICSKMQCKESSNCKSPVRAVGQCCLLCGAIVTFQYGSGYTEAAMESYLNTMLSKSNYEGCHSVLSKINSVTQAASQETHSMQSYYTRANSDYVQVMITDDNTGSNTGKSALAFANEVVDYLESGSNPMGATNVTMRASGSGISQSLSSGAVAGIVIGVIAGVLLITAVVIYYNRRLVHQNKFKLFQYKDDETNIDNPMYDMNYDEKTAVANAVDSSVTGIPSMSAMTSDFGITFGNPLYREEDV